MTASTRHRIGRDNIHTYWSNALAPRITVSPGETVVVETVDCNHGQVSREIDSITRNAIAADLRDLIAAGAYRNSRSPTATRASPAGIR